MHFPLISFILIFLALLGVIFYYILFRYSQDKIPNPLLEYIKDLKECEVIEFLGLEDIIKYFKDPKRLKILKDNRNIIACVIKQDNNNYVTVILAIYDKLDSNVIELKCYSVQKLDENLIRHFGDKDMIILK